jgi:hypothetical protein
MDTKIIGWGVYITKPEYMAEKESFYKKEGYVLEDVWVYVDTLEDLHKDWYITIVEYHQTKDPNSGYMEVSIETPYYRKKRKWKD